MANSLERALKQTELSAGQVLPENLNLAQRADQKSLSNPIRIFVVSLSP